MCLCSYIDKEKLRSIVTSLSLPLNEDGVDRLFSLLDADQDGIISFEEFSLGLEKMGRNPKMGFVGDFTNTILNKKSASK
eukprot:Awhi_evm1s13594